VSSLDAPAVSFWISPSERAVLEVVVRSGTVLLYECGVAYFSTCLDMIPCGPASYRVLGHRLILEFSSLGNSV
jgi:hypothetical protein